jgi:hypothetical protein
VIRLDDFPNAAPDIVGLPVPIIYGDVSDKNEKIINVGTQPKYVSTGNLRYTNVGAAGTWTVQYVVTLVGDETAYPQWLGQNQQDERVLGTITITDAIGPDEFVLGTRYTVVTWDTPGWYATKIYGRFSKTSNRTYQGSSFGYLNFIPRVNTAPSGYVNLGTFNGVPVAIPEATYNTWLNANPGDEARAPSAWYNDSANFFYDEYIDGANGGPQTVDWTEGWFSPSQDQFQPPVAGAPTQYIAGSLSGDSAVSDNARGVIQPIYVGNKRFR